jgi:hypothetical protein
MRWPHPRTLWMAVPQVPVKWLLQKADGMFPEGQRGPRPFAKDSAAAEKTNELLDNAYMRVSLYAGQPGQPLSAVPMLWARPRAVFEPGGGRLPRHSPLGSGRAAYEGAQQPQGLELGAFSPHSHDMPASPALSLCLRQPPGPSNVRERAAGGTLLVDRSRRALGAAACAPARPPRRSRGRRGELSKSSLGVYCCNGRRGLAVQCVTGPGRPRLGVQRPGPGQAVAHGYAGTCRCAGSAVRQAWCLARVAFQRFRKKSVNMCVTAVKTLRTRVLPPPMHLL